MKRSFFGTDGIRGAADGPFFTDAFLSALGAALCCMLKEQDAPLSVVIGRDTRASGERILDALARALTDGGIQVTNAGIVPTPAVPAIVRYRSAGLGIAVTASHNPYTDNGIKLFKADGYKLNDAVELEIEAKIKAFMAQSYAPNGDAVLDTVDGGAIYLESLPHLLPIDALHGIKIVLDTANGATAKTSEVALQALGAELYRIGNTPDGVNINQGIGSEHPEVMSKAVVEWGADLGIAHDGDGDRLILCDEKGQVLDGDTWLAIVGRYLAAEDALPGMAVVATVMSNLGLEECLEKVGATVVRSQVGDRYVLEEMRSHEYVLGGEASGHFILGQHATTGDGLLAALYLLKVLRDSNVPLSRLSQCIRYFPQKKKNLQVKERVALEALPDMQKELNALKEWLGHDGRILLRYSGTEPKIRLLVEHKKDAQASEGMEKLESIVVKYLGN